MLHAKAMQQCDQARAALIYDAAFPFDPGANLTRRARQGLGDPGLEFVLLLARQPAGAALVAEARQPLDPIFLIQAEPGPDRVVVDQQHSGDRLAAHPVVQRHQCVGATRETMGGRPVARQLDQVLPRFAVEEATPCHPIGRIPLAPFRKGVSRILGESGYTSKPSKFLTPPIRARRHRFRPLSRSFRPTFPKTTLGERPPMAREPRIPVVRARRLSRTGPFSGKFGVKTHLARSKPGLEGKSKISRVWAYNELRVPRYSSSRGFALLIAASSRIDRVGDRDGLRRTVPCHVAW